MNVEAENAVMRERARIREEIIKLVPLYTHLTDAQLQPIPLLKRGDVLAILSGDKL